MPKRSFAPGEVLTAANVNEYLSTSRNVIINGAFDIWQRGTSGFSTNTGAFNADRWQFFGDGSGWTKAITRETFTPGAAPVAGYEGQYFWRFAQTVAGTGGANNVFIHKIEDVRTFAGQTVTLSFWAKADAARTVTPSFVQNFGSGGSASVFTSTTSASLTTSWQRFAFTVTLPAITGKTIGSSNYVEIDWYLPVNTTQRIDIWGVQFEEGSTATPFSRATPNIQSELAACQRYYWRAISGNGQLVGNSMTYSSTAGYCTVRLPVTMRTAPSIEVSSGTNHFQFEQNGGGPLVSTLNLGTFFGVDAVGVGANNSVGFSGTAGHAGWLRSFSADARLSFSAEL